MTPASPDGPPPDTAPAPKMAPAPPAFDAAACGAFLEALRGRDAPGCIEFRMWGAELRRGLYERGTTYSLSYSGWYDDPAALAFDAGKLKGVSGYVTVNPCLPALLHRSPNGLARTMARTAKNAGEDSVFPTDDDEIVCYRWIFVDIDAVRPRGISATQAERGAALAVRDKFLADFPEIAACSLWGCSGNGGWILIRVPDLPATDEVKEGVIGPFLKIVAAMYGSAAVSIDPEVRNQSRIMPLAGTVKCKGGDHREGRPGDPARPWRLATMDSPGGDRAPWVGLAGWIEARAGMIGGAAKGAKVNGHAGGHGPGGNGDPAGGGGRPDAPARARRWAESVPAAVAGASGHNKTFEVACGLFEDFDLTPDQAWTILRDYNTRCVPPWEESELRHKLESADQKVTERGKKLNEDRPGYAPPAVKPAINGAVNGHADGIDADDPAKPVIPRGGRASKRVLTGKPAVHVRDKSLDFAIEQSLWILGNLDIPPEMFNFAGHLAWIKTVPGRSAHSFIEAMSADALCNRLAKYITYVSEHETKHGLREMEVFPPMTVVKGVAAQKTWSDGVAPPLELLVESPRFLPDGSLITEPGYHAGANVFYQPTDDIRDIDVPDRPTVADVEAAKGLIFDEYLVDFPFDGPASRANALACMLLPFMRIVIDGPTPLHLFEASTEGTGKSKLANACAFPSLGREIGSNTQQQSEEEWGKAITSVLMGGSTHYFLDNMYNPRSWDGSPEPIESSKLAAALSQVIWKHRILGVNKETYIKIRCVWMGSGNNLEWSKELARRIVPIRLRTPSDNPSDRTGFRHDPLEVWAVENRARLLRACLILCRNWFVNESPEGGQRFGTYESYATVMGGIMDAACIPDFLTNRVRATSKDRESGRWPVLVKLWWDTVGGLALVAGDIYDLMFGRQDETSDKWAWEPQPELQEMFIDVLGDGKPVSQKMKLGHALKKQDDRVWAGFRIVKLDDPGPHGGNQFKLEKVAKTS